jgi:hypothetical protein
MDNSSLATYEAFKLDGPSSNCPSELTLMLQTEVIKKVVQDAKD